MRTIGAVLLFLGVACLLVAGVRVMFPQIRESAEDAGKRFEKKSETGTPPKVEVLGDLKTMPWAFVAAFALHPARQRTPTSSLRCLRPAMAAVPAQAAHA